MRAFDFDDSIDFIQAKIKSSAQKGHGQARKMAQFLGVHPTLISQVIRRVKPLSLESAQGLCEYFGLSESETEYFLSLVQIERAGTAKLKKVYEKQAQALREKGRRLENRLPRDQILTDADKAIFYSNWYYSAIRVLTSVPGFQRADVIAEHLGLPRGLVNQVLTFLVSTGLCLEGKDGLFRVGPQRTLLESDSPLVSRHHANWRNRMIEQYPRMQSHEFAFTAPLSISEKGFLQVRTELANLVEKISQIVSEEEPEKFVCLNIDWLQIKR